MISKKSVLTGILTLGILGLLTGCGSDVSNVKGGVLPELSNNIKVGNTLDEWSKTEECSDTKWESIETSQGAKIVQFTCELDAAKFQKPEDMADGVSEAALAKAEAEAKSDEAAMNAASAASSDANTEYLASLIAAADVASLNAVVAARAADVASLNAAATAATAAMTAVVTKVYALENHLTMKNLAKYTIIQQFNISADGTTFTKGAGGITATFKDGKTAEATGGGIGAMYRNEKIIPVVTFIDYTNRK